MIIAQGLCCIVSSHASVADDAAVSAHGSTSIRIATVLYTWISLHRGHVKLP
jgi:hypothetical protein